jgi:hypothetical protein
MRRILLFISAVVALGFGPEAFSQGLMIPNGVTLEAEIIQDGTHYTGCGIRVFALVALPPGYTGPPRHMEAFDFTVVLFPVKKRIGSLVKASTYTIGLSSKGKTQQRELRRPLEVAFGLPTEDKPIPVLKIHDGDIHDDDGPASAIGVMNGTDGAKVLGTLIAGRPMLVFFQLRKHGTDGKVLRISGQLKPQEKDGVQQCINAVIARLRVK